MLLSDEFLSLLTDYELLFLALSCHYHDLAMAGTEADEATPDTRDQVRRDHAITIGTKISEKWAELGFENPDEAEILGEVCRGHRPYKDIDGHASWNDMGRFKIVGPDQSVRIRLLSALIYSIDELHIGADRAPKRTQDWRNIQNEEARRHWRRHQAIRGPARLPDGTVTYEIVCNTPGFEGDLRKNVLAKAMRAMRDLRQKAIEEGYYGRAPGHPFAVEPQHLLELLLHPPWLHPSRALVSQIKGAVLGLHAQNSASQTSLEGFCIEHGSSEEELSAGTAAASMIKSLRRC